jgi:YSIRK-targeted surface antigen transcriptional regulator
VNNLTASPNVITDLDYMCRLMVQILKIPVSFLDSSFNTIYSYNYGSPDNPFYHSKPDMYSQLFDISAEDLTPIIKTTKYNENYLSLRLVIEGTFIGCFIIGPSVYSLMNEERILSIMEEYNIPLSQKRHISDYYRSLPIMDYSTLIHSGLSLYYMLYNKKLELNDVMLHNGYQDDVFKDIDNNFKINLSHNKQNISFHHSQTLERNMFNCIKNGDSQGLLALMRNPPDGEVGVLSKKNQLRSQKNLAICIVTISTRAAMEGGLDSESAYTLSDIHIQDIEEMKNIVDMNGLITKIACDFAERVHIEKQNKYSPNISKCVTYISKHLYEELNLMILARLVNLNPNYLSELLKKELGVPFAQYVQAERIEEAKRLLSLSSYSLNEIATWLNFHDQSHFTRVFKMHTGLTPKKYRDENIIIYA